MNIHRFLPHSVYHDIQVGNDMNTGWYRPEIITSSNFVFKIIMVNHKTHCTSCTINTQIGGTFVDVCLTVTASITSSTNTRIFSYAILGYCDISLSSRPYIMNTGFPWLTVQFPSCWHGLGSQSSMLYSQLSPLHPLSQEHLYPFTTSCMYKHKIQCLLV